MLGPTGKLLVKPVWLMLANPFNQPLTFIACWFWWSIKRSSTCAHSVRLIDQRGSVNKDFSCQLNLRQCCSHIQKWAGLVDELLVKPVWLMLANRFNQPLTFIACWFWWSIKRSSTCAHSVRLIDQRGSVNKDFSCQLNLRQCCSHIQKWAGLVDEILVKPVWLMLANPFNQPLTFIACWFWWSIKRSSTCAHSVRLIDQRGSVNKDFSCQLNLRQCCSHIQKWAGLVDATDYVAQLAWWVFLDIYMLQYVTYIYVLAVRLACSLWRQPMRKVINHQALTYTSCWPVDWWTLTHRLGSQTRERDLRCQRPMGPLF